MSNPSPFKPNNKRSNTSIVLSRDFLQHNPKFRRYLFALVPSVRLPVLPI